MNITGILESSERKSEKNGWVKYATVISGKEYEVSSPPPRDGDERYEPEEGDSVILFPFKNGNGYTIKKDDPKKSASTAGSADYWARKFEYEISEKDPHLKFQGFLNIIAGVYTSVMGKLDLKYSSVDDVDSLEGVANEVVDRIFDKTSDLLK